MMSKKHTSPEMAGEQNMKAIVIKTDDEKSELEKHNGKMMGKIIRLRNLRKGENVSKWSEEQFRDSMDELLEWCNVNEIELSAPLMRVWFNVSQRMFDYWRTDPKYGFFYEVINEAYSLMEIVTLSKIEKYPVGNIFKLKAVHKYSDVQKIDVTTNGKDFVSQDEVKDMVSKLGLDK